MAGESARAVASRDRARAERLLRDAEKYERGAAGEEVTAHALTELPENEWQVFHDVRWPGRQRANIDHVAVGPQGVVVIDTKAWSGEIDVTAGVLRQDGRRRNKFVEASVNAAEAVGGLLPGLSPEAVLPVLCFVRPEPVFGWAGEVMVCSTDNLVRMMAARPRLLDDRAVLRATEALRTTLEPAAESVVRVAPPVSAPPRRRRRRRATSEGLVGRFVLLGVVCIIVSTLMRLDVIPSLGVMRDRGEQTISELRNPSSPAGETVTLRQTPTRPALDVTVDAPVATRSTTASVRVLPGNVLLAVPMTIRNAGGTTWASFPDTTVLLRDSGGQTYRPNPTMTRVRSGRVLPAAIRLGPGRTTRGLMVFEVPRGTTVDTVELEAGRGKPDVLRWKVG